MSKSTSSTSKSKTEKTDTSINPYTDFVVDNLPVEPVLERSVPNVPGVPLFPLTEDHIFDKKTGKPHLDRLKQHFLREGRLEKSCALRLVREAHALFNAEPNMHELRYPITVCGDIHGQFFDLIRLFDVGGDPKDTQYLFLGDYVDRGCFSTEVVFYLYAHKICYPNTFFMLRGNHECRQLTSFFNFKTECAYKYDLEMYDAIMESFDVLPIAAMVNKSFFCVHGGLSPEISTLTEVRKLNRRIEVPREGPMCDLLWSDPYEDDLPSSDSSNWFQYNDTRQCSWVFGIEAVKTFLDENRITSIIRAHEAQVDGYKMHMVNRSTNIPRVMTIFSAPNYCDLYKNKAACLKFDHNILNIKQFVESAHPYYLPNFMDVFQWSLPFVAEKVTDMLAHVLNFDSQHDEETPADRKNVVEAKGGMLKQKVMAVSKILRMYKVLRQENEAIVQIKQLTPNHKVPTGVLSQGADGIKGVLSNFESAKAADADYEKFPGAMQAPAEKPQPRKFRKGDE